MDKLLAKLTLAELITPARWTAFTDWLEEGDETQFCAHDQSDYEDWLREQGDPDVELRADKIWHALATIAPGPCRCVAGAGIWTGKELDGLTQPVVFARPLDLPRALTGLPESPSDAQVELYSRFYGANRGRLSDFWQEVPEPAFDGDVKAGMAFAQVMAKLAVLSPEHEPYVQTSAGKMNFFFHSAEAEVVEGWLRERGHALVPFEGVLDALALYVVRHPDGSPATGARVTVGDRELPPAVDFFDHVVVVRPDTEQVFGDRWYDLSEGGAKVRAAGREATLSAGKAAGVHVLTLS